MYIETWHRYSCPKCKKNNWICDGDVTDLTKADTDAIKCWSCGHDYWITEDPDWLQIAYGEDAKPEDASTESKEKPE